MKVLGNLDVNKQDASIHFAFDRKDFLGQLSRWTCMETGLKIFENKVDTKLVTVTTRLKMFEGLSADADRTPR